MCRFSKEVEREEAQEEHIADSAALAFSMQNPLRFPFVLIGLLALMVGYVHYHHRLRAKKRAEGDFVASSAEGVELRGSAGRSGLEVRKSAGSSEEHAPSAAQSTGAPVPASEEKASTKSASVPQPRFIRTPRDGETVATADPRAAKSAAIKKKRTRSKPRFAPGPRVATLGRDRDPVRGPKTPAVYTRRTSRRAKSHIRKHRIVDGDTLRQLANRYLGDERRYLEIFAANRQMLTQPDLLPLGVTLIIPSDRATSGSQAGS